MNGTRAVREFMRDLQGAKEDARLEQLWEADPTGVPSTAHETKPFVNNNLSMIGYALAAGFPVTKWKAAAKDPAADDQVARAVRQWQEASKLLVLRLAAGQLTLQQFYDQLLTAYQTAATNAFVAGRRSVGNAKGLTPAQTQALLATTDAQAAQLATGVGVTAGASAGSAGIMSVLGSLGKSSLTPANLLGSGLPVTGGKAGLLASSFASPTNALQLLMPGGGEVPEPSLPARLGGLGAETAPVEAAQQAYAALPDYFAAVGQMGNQIATYQSQGEMDGITEDVPADATMVWWVLGDGDHCIDCVQLSDASPFYASMLDDEGIFPGSGHTRCGNNCNCDTEYDIPDEVCMDPMSGSGSLGDLDIGESGKANVWIMEDDGSCDNPISIDGLAGFDFGGMAISLLDDIPESDAYTWAEDVSTQIEIDQPLESAVTYPQIKATVERTASKEIAAAVADVIPVPPTFAEALENLRNIVPGGYIDGLQVTRYQIEGTTYHAIWQRTADAVRLEAGLTTKGLPILNTDFTIKAISDLSDYAAKNGLRFDVNGATMNPGLAKWLHTLGADALDFGGHKPDVEPAFDQLSVLGRRSVPQIRPRGIPPLPAPFVEPAESLDAMAKRVPDITGAYDPLKGASPKALLTDSNGDDWLVKYSAEAGDETGRARAMPEIIGTQVHERLGMDVAPVGPTELTDRAGTIQQIIPGSKGISSPGQTAAAIAGNLNHLSAANATEVMRQGIVDQLIGNADGHLGNWVYDAQGRVIGIDKGLAFWQLPNRLGIRKTANLLGDLSDPWTELDDAGQMVLRVPPAMRNVRVSDLAEIVDRIDSWPDADYMAFVDPAIPGLVAGGKTFALTGAEWREIILDRKEQLRSQVDTFLSLATDEAAKAGPLPDDWELVRQTRHLPSELPKPGIAPGPETLILPTPTFVLPEVDELPAWPDMGRLTYDVDVQKLAGGNPDKYVLTDPAGQRWLGKTEGPDAEVAAAQIGQRLGLRLPPVQKVTYDDQVLALQPIIADASTIKAVESLTSAQITEVTRQSVLDFVIANEDTHPGNFLTDAEGALWGIDKGRSFAGGVVSSTNALGFFASPETVMGQLLLTGTSRARLLKAVNPADVKLILDRLDGISEADYRAIVGEVAKTVANPFGTVEESITVLLKRKAIARAKFEELFSTTISRAAPEDRPDVWTAWLKAGGTFDAAPVTTLDQPLRLLPAPGEAALLPAAMRSTADHLSRTGNDLATWAADFKPAATAKEATARLAAALPGTSKNVLDGFTLPQLNGILARAESMKAMGVDMTGLRRLGDFSLMPAADRAKAIGLTYKGDRIALDHEYRWAFLAGTPQTDTVYNDIGGLFAHEYGHVLFAHLPSSQQAAMIQLWHDATTDGLSKYANTDMDEWVGEVLSRVTAPGYIPGTLEYDDRFWTIAASDGQVKAIAHDGAPGPMLHQPKPPSVHEPYVPAEPIGPPIPAPKEVSIKQGDAQMYSLPDNPLPINAPMAQWSGYVPAEPALPPLTATSADKAAAKVAHDAAIKDWHDVVSGKVDAAFSWGKADADAATAAGLHVEKIGDKYVIARGPSALDPLKAIIAEGKTADSDEFWHALGYSDADLAAYDAYYDVSKGLRQTAGVVMVEPDGRVWLLAPKNHFAGYENTFTKGGVDAGETPAEAAVREVREEAGFSVELDSYLGDYVNTDKTGVARMYIGHRTGGGPLFAGPKETYAVRLVDQAQGAAMLIRYGKPDARDQQILADAIAHVTGSDPITHLSVPADDAAALAAKTTPTSDPKLWWPPAKTTAPKAGLAPGELPLSTSFGYDHGQWTDAVTHTIDYPPSTTFPMAQAKWMLPDGTAQPMFWQVKGGLGSTPQNDMLFWANSKKQLADPKLRLSLHMGQITRFGDYLAANPAIDTVRVNEALLANVPGLRDALVAAGGQTVDGKYVEISSENLQKLGDAIKANEPLSHAAAHIPATELHPVAAVKGWAGEDPAKVNAALAGATYTNPVVDFFGNGNQLTIPIGSNAKKVAWKINNGDLFVMAGGGDLTPDDFRTLWVATTSHLAAVADKAGATTISFGAAWPGTDSHLEAMMDALVAKAGGTTEPWTLTLDQAKAVADKANLAMAVDGMHPELLDFAIDNPPLPLGATPTFSEGIWDPVAMKEWTVLDAGNGYLWRVGTSSVATSVDTYGAAVKWSFIASKPLYVTPDAYRAMMVRQLAEIDALITKDVSLDTLLITPDVIAKLTIPLRAKLESVGGYYDLDGNLRMTHSDLNAFVANAKAEVPDHVPIKIPTEAELTIAGPAAAPAAAAVMTATTSTAMLDALAGSTDTKIAVAGIVGGLNRTTLADGTQFDWRRLGNTLEAHGMAGADPTLGALILRMGKVADDAPKVDGLVIRKAVALTPAGQQMLLDAGGKQIASGIKLTRDQLLTLRDQIAADAKTATAEVAAAPLTHVLADAGADAKAAGELDLVITPQKQGFTKLEWMAPGTVAVTTTKIRTLSDTIVWTGIAGPDKSEASVRQLLYVADQMDGKAALKQIRIEVTLPSGIEKLLSDHGAYVVSPAGGGPSVMFMNRENLLALRDEINPEIGHAPATAILQAVAAAPAQTFTEALGADPKAVVALIGGKPDVQNLGNGLISRTWANGAMGYYTIPVSAYSHLQLHNVIAVGDQARQDAFLAQLQLLAKLAKDSQTPLDLMPQAFVGQGGAELRAALLTAGGIANGDMVTLDPKIADKVAKAIADDTGLAAEVNPITGVVTVAPFTPASAGAKLTDQLGIPTGYVDQLNPAFSADEFEAHASGTLQIAAQGFSEEPEEFSWEHVPTADYSGMQLTVTIPNPLLSDSPTAHLGRTLKVIQLADASFQTELAGTEKLVLIVSPNDQAVIDLLTAAGVKDEGNGFEISAAKLDWISHKVDANEPFDQIVAGSAAAIPPLAVKPDVLALTGFNGTDAFGYIGDKPANITAGTHADTILQAQWTAGGTNGSLGVIWQSIGGTDKNDVTMGALSILHDFGMADLKGNLIVTSAVLNGMAGPGITKLLKAYGAVEDGTTLLMKSDQVKALGHDLHDLAGLNEPPQPKIVSIHSLLTGLPAPATEMHAGDEVISSSGKKYTIDVIHADGTIDLKAPDGMVTPDLTKAEMDSMGASGWTHGGAPLGDHPVAGSIAAPAAAAPVVKAAELPGKYGFDAGILAGLGDPAKTEMAQGFRKLTWTGTLYKAVSAKYRESNVAITLIGIDKGSTEALVDSVRQFAKMMDDKASVATLKINYPLPAGTDQIVQMLVDHGAVSGPSGLTMARKDVLDFRDTLDADLAGTAKPLTAGGFKIGDKVKTGAAGDELTVTGITPDGKVSLAYGDGTLASAGTDPTHLIPVGPSTAWKAGDTFTASGQEFKVVAVNPAGGLDLQQISNPNSPVLKNIPDGGSNWVKTGGAPVQSAHGWSIGDKAIGKKGNSFTVTAIDPVTGKLTLVDDLQGNTIPGINPDSKLLTHGAAAPAPRGAPPGLWLKYGISDDQLAEIQTPPLNAYGKKYSAGYIADQVAATSSYYGSGAVNGGHSAIVNMRGRVLVAHTTFDKLAYGDEAQRNAAAYAHVRALLAYTTDAAGNGTLPLFVSDQVLDQAPLLKDILADAGGKAKSFMGSTGVDLNAKQAAALAKKMEASGFPTGGKVVEVGDDVKLASGYGQSFKVTAVHSNGLVDLEGDQYGTTIVKKGMPANSVNVIGKASGGVAAPAQSLGAIAKIGQPVSATTVKAGDILGTNGLMETYTVKSVNPITGKITTVYSGSGMTEEYDITDFQGFTYKAPAGSTPAYVAPTPTIAPKVAPAPIPKVAPPVAPPITDLPPEPIPGPSSAPATLTPSFLYGYDHSVVNTVPTDLGTAAYGTGKLAGDKQVMGIGGVKGYWSVSPSGSITGLFGLDVPAGAAVAEKRSAAYSMLLQVAENGAQRPKGFFIKPEFYDQVDGLRQMILDAGGIEANYPNLGTAVAMDATAAQALVDGLRSDVMGPIKPGFGGTSGYLGFDATTAKTLFATPAKMTGGQFAWDAGKVEVQGTKDWSTAVIRSVTGTSVTTPLALAAQINWLAEQGTQDLSVAKAVLDAAPGLHQWLLSIGGEVQGNVVHLDETAVNNARRMLVKDALPEALGGAPIPYSVVDSLNASTDQMVDAISHATTDKTGLMNTSTFAVDSLGITTKWTQSATNIYWDSTARGAASIGQARSAVAAQLRTFANEIAQNVGIERLDISAKMLADQPGLLGVLRKYGATEMPAAGGQDAYWSISRGSVVEIRKNLEAEFSLLGPADGTSTYIAAQAAVIQWPAAEDMTYDLNGTLALAGGKTTAGAVAATDKLAVYKDAAGNDWLFKPGKSGRGAITDKATADLARQLGLPVPPVRIYTLNLKGETVTGSLQKIIPGTKTLKKGVADLDPTQTEDMLKASVMDWVTNNDDAHAGNWLIAPDGHLWAIDKSRSYQTWGRDALDNSYNGNGYKPLMMEFFTKARADPSMLASIHPQSLNATLRSLNAITEEDFRALMKPVAEANTKDAAAAAKLLDEMVARKNATATDFEAYIRGEIAADVKASPGAVPPEWKSWLSSGGHFNLNATPEDLWREKKATLEAKYGKFSVATYKAQTAKTGKTIQALVDQYVDGGLRSLQQVGARFGGHGHLPGAPSLTVTADMAKRVAGVAPEGGYAANLLPLLAPADEYQQWQEVQQWAILSIADGAAGPRGKAADDYLRQMWDPATGTFTVGRGSGRFPTPAAALADYQKYGLKSLKSYAVPGHEWSGNKFFAIVGYDQLISTDATDITRGEYEYLVRDIRLDQLVRILHGQSMTPAQIRAYVGPVAV